MKTLSVFLPLILSSVISSVWGFEELGEVALQPMQKPLTPPFVSGTEVHWLKNGQVSIHYYESVDAESYSIRVDDGCTWTRKTYLFAPTLRWDQCEAASGTQTITKTKGSPWPLSEKTEFQHEYAGKYKDDLGQPWHSVRKCKVGKSVRVKVPAGEYNTYKLICEDVFLERIFWVSPELGHYVALEEKSKIYISRWYMLELVKVINP